MVRCRDLLEGRKFDPDNKPEHSGKRKYIMNHIIVIGIL